MNKKNLTLLEWQRAITKVATEKGFTWQTGEIDTVLLRIASEITEASEAVRDIPIKRTLKLHWKDDKNKSSGLFHIILNDDGTFDQTVSQGIVISGSVTEELDNSLEYAEQNDNLAEEFADIFIRLANAAEVMGIDLELECMKKYEKNKARPPRHGRGRK